MISNNQQANETSFNQAFVSKTHDSFMNGRLLLQFIDGGQTSGLPITDVQKQLNSLLSFLGQTSNGAKNAKPAWTSNAVGQSSDDVKTRLDLITALFAAAGGHTHSGEEGQGAPLGVASLVGLLGSFAAPVEVPEGGASLAITKVISVACVRGQGGPATVDVANLAGPINLGLLVLVGTDDTKILTLTAASSAAVKLNGDCPLGAGSSIIFLKIGSLMIELTRNMFGGYA